jgi:uncharacterized membrane protein
VWPSRRRPQQPVRRSNERDLVLTAQNIWKILHILSLFIYTGGLGGVLVPLYSGWSRGEVQYQSVAFQQAAQAETSVLLPGMLLTGLTGVFWAASAGYSYIRDLWLLALAGLYLFSIFICLPLMGVGLRRARLLALQAAKTGRMSEALRETLNDNVPMVFGTVMALLLPVMAWLAIFKP